VTLDAGRLMEMRDDAERIVTVAAAVEAGLFEALRELGGGTPAEVAERAGLDPRAVRIVLAPLADLGLVEGDGERYTLSSEGARLFGDPEADGYAGGGMGLWLANLGRWTRLGETLRTGRPPEDVPSEAEEDEETRIARFMAGMAAAPRDRVERTVELVMQRASGPRAMLDLGGGPGHFARAFADRGMRATVLDLPETVRYVAGAYGLEMDERIDLVGADFTSDPLPDGPFDIVLLSNVTHMLGAEENAALLRAVRGVMRPGGVVAIGDFVRGRSGRADGFALVMLLRTDRGDTYTEDAYRAWLSGAGFSDVRMDDVDPDRQLVTAIAA
jgi:SAM-dependent methyltransferase